MKDLKEDLNMDEDRDILRYLKRTFNSPLKEKGLSLDIKVPTTIKEEEMNSKNDNPIN